MAKSKELGNGVCEGFCLGGAAARDVSALFDAIGLDWFNDFIFPKVDGAGVE